MENPTRTSSPNSNNTSVDNSIYLSAFSEMLNASNSSGDCYDSNTTTLANETQDILLKVENSEKNESIIGGNDYNTNTKLLVDAMKHAINKSTHETAVANDISKEKTERKISLKNAGNEHKLMTDDAIQAREGLPITKRKITVYASIEEFEQNLPPTVTVLRTPFGSKVYLVGTAHYSEDSQDDVSEVIRNVRPDVITVELCPSRLHIIKLSEQSLLEEVKSLNVLKAFDIIKAHGCVTGVLYILLLQMSAQVAKDLSMAPGGEFRRAYEEIIHTPKCVLQFGDRPIHITLQRVLHALSTWQIMKLAWRVIFSDTISNEEVEKCKDRDLLESLLKEMAGEFPAFSEVFVKERDLFLCHSLQLAAVHQVVDDDGNTRPVRVVGVVGIGHAEGIEKLWGQVTSQQINLIREVPPASLATRICVKTFKYGFFGLLLLGAFKVARPRLGRFI